MAMSESPRRKQGGGGGNGGAKLRRDVPMGLDLAAWGRRKKDNMGELRKKQCERRELRREGPSPCSDVKFMTGFTL